MIAATVGPASAQGLRELPGFGANTTVLHPPADAPSHDSEALWAVLQDCRAARAHLAGARHAGRDWLGDTLAAHGVRVARHAAYDRQPAVWEAQSLAPLKRRAEAGLPATWLITSGEGADAALANLRAAGLQAWWEGCGFVLTHPSWPGASAALVMTRAARRW